MDRQHDGHVRQSIILRNGKVGNIVSNQLGLETPRHIRGRPRRSQSELDLQAVGQKIRQLRGAARQEDFARALNISQAQLSKYELGQSALPLSLLAKLAERSGRTTDWILAGKG
jgi:hypothetical protein